MLQHCHVLITVRNEVAKVMFLHLSVSHSVHGGSTWAGTPRGGTPPPPLTGTPHRQVPPRQVHPPGQVPPQAGTAPPGQVHPPRWVHPTGRYTPPGRYPQVHPLGRYTPQARTSPRAGTPRQVPPQQTVTVADGTHPTGMHSCYLTSYLLKFLLAWLNMRDKLYACHLIYFPQMECYMLRFLYNEYFTFN